MTNIVIGIQARSGSTRFPKKVFAKIDGKSVLQHVIDNCKKSAKYLNKYSFKNHYRVQVVLIVPYNDEIVDAFSNQIKIIQGPENDVLKRYKILSDKTNADYIVRVTSDCVLLPPYLITKAIKNALVNKYDYISNVYEKFRTAPDGYDVEVVSKKLLDFSEDHFHEESDREHVTTGIRRSPPEWAKMGVMINYLDQSEFKISLDTKEDLENIERLYLSVKEKLQKACDLVGDSQVHKN